jgi:hypothetical protein
VFIGVLSRKVGSALLTQGLRPTYPVALKIHHRFVALLWVGDHAVVDRAHLDPAGDRILQVDGDGLGLAGRQVAVDLGTEGRLELNEVAGHTDAHVPNLSADTHLASGDLGTAKGGILLHSSQGIHFGVELDRLRPLALRLVVCLEHGDVPKDIGRNFLAHAPEAAAGAGCCGLLFQQLEIQILARLIGGPGQQSNPWDKSALVGDDLVEPSG